MRNFVNDAVFGTYKCSTCGGSVGQEDFFADLMEWWNSLEPMYQYAIIGGAGLIVVALVLIIATPAKVRGIEQLEELMRLKMMKEMIE